MGFSISWLAFQGPSKDQVLTSVQLLETEIADEFNKSPYSGAPMPNGWYVISLNKFGHQLVSPQSLSALSKDCRIISAQVEEHVMYSSSCEYARGLRKWAVSHESEKDSRNLETQGELPERFEQIRNEVIKQQDDEDKQAGEVDFIFEIPVLLAKSVCGYQHDLLEFDWGKPSFTQLKQATPDRSFLAKLLRPSR